MEDGGHAAVVLSDRAQILTLRIDRTPRGAISGVSIAQARTVPDPPVEDGLADTEGLAIAPDGKIFMAFEGRSLIAEYRGSTTPPRPLPIPDAFDDLGSNRGLESVASAPDGAIWTVPESHRGGLMRTFTWRDGAWLDGPDLPDDGSAFVPVGLDFDDAGRLYALERRFLGPFGFASRLRRFTLVDGTLTKTETLLETDPGQHDNLEGLAIWHDNTGRLISTMISDDNFFALQRTELVEYVLPE